jgi:hypothetical protein
MENFAMEKEMQISVGLRLRYSSMDRKNVDM